MHKRTTRLNRVFFVLLGLLLLAAGLFVLGRYLDLFDALPKTEHVYSGAEARWIHRNRWIFIVVAVAAGLVALAALRWILVQPRIDRARRIQVESGHDQVGRTTLASDVLTDAVEDDVDTYPGVSGTRALIIGAEDAPELVVRVAAQPSAELSDILRRVATEAIPAARIALDRDDLPAQIHLVVAGRKPAQRIIE